ncbi:MAG: VOC family protein [Actinomycetota bacterium]|nr:VOC family protein [Actinomycetota bacterium]
MPRVVHFELPVDDPDRAIAFYRAVFGWKIEKWEGPDDYWLVMTGAAGEPGIDGALARRSAELKSTQNTIDVLSLDEAIAKVIEGGGTVVAPRTTIPGVGYFAYCSDTEGNIFGMMESDESASL